MSNVPITALRPHMSNVSITALRPYMSNAPIPALRPYMSNVPITALRPYMSNVPIYHCQPTQLRLQHLATWRKVASLAGEPLLGPEAICRRVERHLGWMEWEAPHFMGLSHAFEQRVRGLQITKMTTSAEHLSIGRLGVTRPRRSQPPSPCGLRSRPKDPQRCGP